MLGININAMYPEHLYFISYAAMEYADIFGVNYSMFLVPRPILNKNQ